MGSSRGFFPDDVGRIVFVTGGAFTPIATEFLDRLGKERRAARRSEGSALTGGPMLNNDVLRSLRYILKTDDPTVAAIVGLGGGAITRTEVAAFMKEVDEPGYATCSHRLMACFLDGLIVHRRGRQEGAAPAPLEKIVTNNVVLKKLRVAFELKDSEVIAMMADGGCPVSRSELSALCRVPSHNNFRAAGDQFLRNFLRSLTTRMRG